MVAWVPCFRGPFANEGRGKITAKTCEFCKRACFRGGEPRLTTLQSSRESMAPGVSIQLPFALQNKNLLPRTFLGLEFCRDRLIRPYTKDEFIPFQAEGDIRHTFLFRLGPIAPNLDPLFRFSCHKLGPKHQSAAPGDNHDPAAIIDYYLVVDGFSARDAFSMGEPDCLAILLAFDDCPDAFD